MIQKRCSRCGEHKSQDEFSKDSSTYDRLNPRCRACMSEVLKKSRKKDPEFNKKQRESLKRRRLEDYRNRPKIGGTCTNCGVSGGPEIFYSSRSASTGRDSWCKDCRRPYSRRMSWRAYGIDLDSADEVLKASDGTCDICGYAGRLHLDHDHSTGMARGMLCQRCNFGLGFFRDSVEFLKNAQEYISRHNLK